MSSRPFPDNIDWSVTHNVVLTRCLIAKFSPSSIAEAFGLTRNVFAGFFNKISFRIPKSARPARPEDIRAYAESIGIKTFALVRRSGELAARSDYIAEHLAEPYELVTDAVPFEHLMAPDNGPRPKSKPVSLAGKPSPDATSTRPASEKRPRQTKRSASVLQATVAQNVSTFGNAALAAVEEAVELSEAEVVVFPVEKTRRPAPVLAETVFPTNTEPPGDNYESLPYPTVEHEIDTGVERDRQRESRHFPHAKTLFELTVNTCRTPLSDYTFRDADGAKVDPKSVAPQDASKYKIQYLIDKRPSREDTQLFCGAPTSSAKTFCDRCMKMLRLTSQGLSEQRQVDRIKRELARREALKRRPKFLV